MKYCHITIIDSDNLCEWVKETTEKHPDTIVNAFDLNDDSDYIRIGDIVDDEEVEIIYSRCTPINELDMEDEWVPFDSLYYDSTLGLRINR